MKSLGLLKLRTGTALAETKAMTRSMRLLPIILVALVSGPMTSSAAEGGNHGGGGGDPTAIGFVIRMKQIKSLLDESPDIVPSLNRNQLNQLVHNFDASLGGESKIRVQESRPLDPYGVPKAAVFSTKPLQITVHRASFEEATPEKQVTLAAMEILGLLGQTSARYETAVKQISEKMVNVLWSHSKDQAALYFLKQTRNPRSAIAKKLESVRVELANGFVLKDQVIPTSLKRSDLEIITESSDVYAGKRLSPDEFEPGYQHWQFRVSVAAKSATYGGHISEVTGVTFICKIDQEPTAKRPKFSCSELEEK